DDMAGYALDMPGQIHELLTRTIEEELKIGFVHYGLKGLIGEVSGLGTKILIGMIISSLLLSSTLFLILGKEEVGKGWLQALGGIGYGFGMIIVVILVIKVYMRRKPWL
ncbi:MAG: hypothetical protein ACE5IH_07245, partial [Thermodesulfobacteriota bacterium]